MGSQEESIGPVAQMDQREAILRPMSGFKSRLAHHGR